MPKGYLIGHITVNDPDAYREYAEKNTPILGRFGAKLIVLGGVSETIEGASQDRQMVIEFPDFDTVNAAYHDPEYQKVTEIRRRTATSTIILVEGT